MATLICDTECYPNYFLAAFKRVSDGKVVALDKTADPGIERELDRDRLETILRGHKIVGYNMLGYDLAMLWAAVRGWDNVRLKDLSDSIIVGRVPWWGLEELCGFRFPRIDVVDLMEPQPNAVASLKTLNGRLHGRTMQDLPYEPGRFLTINEMREVRAYCGNDLDATHLLYDALKEPLEVRELIGKDIGVDIRSKSDTQVGMAILKKRVEQLTGTRIEKPKFQAGRTFRYGVPPYIKFHAPQLQGLLEEIRAHSFIVGPKGKVELPDFLAKAKITIGGVTGDAATEDELHDRLLAHGAAMASDRAKQITLGGSTYQMGLGGLHSTEANRSVYSTNTHILIDADVASYYPAIILTLGLYPVALGPHMLKAYAAIRADRLAAKTRGKAIVKELEALRARPADSDEAKRLIKRDYLRLDNELAAQKAIEKGLKISLNGFFGNTSNPHSFAYSPQMTIAITLTGQLALLMLIERAEHAGFAAVSGNTDGVTFLCPRDRTNQIEKDRFVEFAADDIPFGLTLKEITDQWERDTGFDLEFVAYRSIHNVSVNNYFAIKEDGEAKRKGLVNNPWGPKGDLREQLMKNPSMTVCSNAALAFIKDGVPVEDTIRADDDIRNFVTVVNVRGGGTWRGEYLGKVVRYVWATDGEPIFYKLPHPTTGNFKKVSKTDGARPMMTLEDTIPFGLDYGRYVDEANEILRDMGVLDRPPPEPKPPRLTKARALDLLRLAAVA